MCGAIRLVLLGNDKCLRDSALRGGHFVIFEISLHLSAEIADLQNVDYLSMFVSAVLFASIVMGILNSL